MGFKSTDYPYDSVAYVTATVGNVTYRASGVFITPDEVLTASHVVYQMGVGSASEVTVTPGYDNGSAPFGTYRASYFHYNPIDDSFGMIRNAESQNDFAVIHLNHPVNVGTMGVQADFGGGAVNVTAYPGYAGTGQVTTPETVYKNPNFSLLNGAPTGAGTSGGPLWVMQDGRANVVGLVSSESSTTAYNVQITGSVAAQIQAWLHQDDFTDPLVDNNFYRAAYPDVAVAPMSPSYHYEASGWREGRDPNPYFSTRGYLGANADVRAGGVDPLQHYDQTGWHEGRDPSANFDTGLYLLHNPDVAQSGVDPLMQFLTEGRYQGRSAYAAIGPAATIKDGFDREYYLLANPDVAASGIDPAQHYFAVGWHEGRNPNAFFDVRGYLSAYADVRAADVDPLTHYDRSGWHEGRDPSAGFDTRAYLSAYGDVAEAGANPLQHYLTNGAYEFRDTFADGKFFS